MIEAAGLSHSYKMGERPLQVLHGLSFKIGAGEMVAIQGPSGSGKSTLMYLLGCLQKVQEGKLRVNGTDVSALDDAQLARFRNHSLGFVFQQFHLLARGTVLENILLPSFYPVESAAPGKAEKSRAVALATQLGLGDRLDHLPNQLSGGQQQRVAIARALINDPPLILADEPTGNLDSQSSAQILDLLRSLQREGRTILIITHDPEVAARCDRVLHVRDGKLTDAPSGPEAISPHSKKEERKMPGARRPLPLIAWLRLMLRQMPLAWDSLNRNRARSALTMLGITIGIAAVLSMVTLGQFTKRKILESYADLGINNLTFEGYPNWRLKATDAVTVPFRFFSWEKDVVPLPRIFPQIKAISPALHSWGLKLTFAGKTMDKDNMMAMGVNENVLPTFNRTLEVGRSFSSYHIANASPVCLVGRDIATELLANTIPLGQILKVEMNNKTLACRVIGVLKHAGSKSEWFKPDLQVLMPYTYFRSYVDNYWSSEIHNVNIQLQPGSDVEKVGSGIRAFFERKYGKAGHFSVNTDSVLVSQMKKFLSLFSLLLTVIALVSLGVGGMGITNMMLVSVSERLREIGLRKALGASPASIRTLFLTEAILICSLGGGIGILLGFGTYHLAIYGATKLVPKLEFAWTMDWSALGLSVASIALVGVLSGLFPALKAEKLEVIEAIRSE
ncbi:MAG TPA: ATP-binding cassette domain-containing protein [Bdellovibrionota bacterium]|jgi:macrolide transport system ATP-binding/permease protein